MAGQLIPERPPLFDPALPPSSSLLFYLFAEQVAPKSLLGTKAPDAAVRVDTPQLGRMLLAVAFWHVRELGLVRLEVQQKRAFLRTKTSIAVVLAPGGNTAPHRDGIEGGLLDVLTPGSLHQMTPAWRDPPQWTKDLTEQYAARLQRMVDTISARPEYANLPNLAQLKQPVTSHRPPPATIMEAIREWYGRDITHPMRLPISWTEQEGIAKGFLMEGAERNSLATAVFGKASAVGDPVKILSVEPAFMQVRERWQTFHAREPALAQELEREVAEGIEKMRYISPSTGGGG